jgi:anti-sigma factor RsiW
MPGRYVECTELFAALSAYLDEELPQGDCAEIEAHIAQCAPCVDFVESLKKSVELCRVTGNAMEPPPLAPDVREQLLQAYRRSVEQPEG